MDLELKGIRGGTRIPVELPVQVHWKSSTGIKRNVQGRTESMSGNGLFIVAPLRLRRGMPITFTIPLPAAVTHVPVQLRCVGRVIRQHKSKTGMPPGVGVIIDDYRFSTVKQLS